MLATLVGVVRLIVSGGDCVVVLFLDLQVLLLVAFMLEALLLMFVLQLACSLVLVGWRPVWLAVLAGCWQQSVVGAGVGGCHWWLVLLSVLFGASLRCVSVGFGWWLVGLAACPCIVHLS